MPDARSESDQEKQSNSQTAETRQIRGLSQRLRKPLTVEANLPSDLSAPESAVESPIAHASESLPVESSAGETRAVATIGAQKTRQVAPAKAQSHREGLLSVGVQLQGRYKILGVIGVGGMGAVYKAQDLRFSGVVRLCAMKEMINTATDPQVRQMIVRNFEREASILATLSHPVIPQVYDYFTEGSRSYLVMEFVDGKDLEALLSEVEGFLPEAKVVDWAAQLCDVLSYLHNHKPRPIIFRDLKPANIMLDKHDRIRLVDFGIAKLFQSGAKGTIIGTEGYSPPEQYRGVAEPRGDIYALGATLHHLLSKQNPQLEPPFSFHERPIHKTNPTVSRELVEVIDKTLQYDINLRWGSAEEFKRALLGVPSARGLSSGASTSEGNASNTSLVKPIWRFVCEDEIRGSVAIKDKTLYIPCYDNNLYALNLDSGKFIWKYATEGGIASTPWVAENRVVFGSTDKMVYAVDTMTGQLMWVRPTKGRIFSSPYVEYNYIFIGSDDRSIYVINLQNGSLAWTYPTNGEVRARPLVVEDLIFFTCQMGYLYCLSGRNLRWQFHARRGILSAPVVGAGLVFVGSLDNNFYAIDVDTGLKVWTYRAGGSIVSTASIWNNLVFFGSADGYVYAMDVDDGRVVWRHQTEGQVTASPMVSQDAVYIGGVDGALYCLDAKSGALRWRYQTEGAITGTPVVVGGVVYIGSSDHYVYAIPA
ncbi:MAG: PQQ-binding-like beta-propeller repeat protein [Anaerolineae bacterium]|nr:PQQ-binding-like beta-propeller repeat protein [Anaerolineae bacterium]